MSLFGTATSWLVEPADESVTKPRVVASAPRPSSGAAPLARVAVLGSPAAVPPLAAAVALACRARARVPSALIAHWPAVGDDDRSFATSGPALPGAAALAARLSRRGLRATARGRLVWLTLPAAGDEASAMLGRAAAAAGDLPMVLALARPRDPFVNEMITEIDLLVVAAPPGSALARAAGADVHELRLPICVCAPLPPGPLRLAALAGLRGPHLDLSFAPPGPAPIEEAW